MAKKFWKVAAGLGVAAVAGKLAYDKYKDIKQEFDAEEEESLEDDVKKYNSIFASKVVELEEEFEGCEVKTMGSKMVLDLGLATFEKDVYINFTSTASLFTIILPEGVNVECDVDRQLSGIRNLVDNTDEEGINTVYVLGKAVCSSIEVIPVDFFVEDDDIEDFDEEDSEEDSKEGLKEDSEEDNSEEKESEKKDSEIMNSDEENSDELEIKEVE